MMELISTISDVLLYFSIALVVVVTISYVLFSYISNKNNEDDKKVLKEREKIRQYIVSQQRFLLKKTADSEALNYKTYIAPTYSEIEVQHHSQLNNKDINNFRKNASVQRYKIINKTGESEIEKESINRYHDSHRLFKESKHNDNS